ncbi:hypothetical protein, partial [Bacillus toyonensis]|uniref:hypothetical protein n=1 Tax=Bacillus toyonensis TaxID=155322 RepID=UPI002FFD9EB6
GSKTPTSKFSKSKEVKWGMNKAPLIKVSFYIEEILNTNQGNKILYYISSMPFIRRKNDNFRQHSIFYEFYSYFCQKYVGNVLSLLCICAILFPVSDFK